MTNISTKFLSFVKQTISKHFSNTKNYFFSPNPSKKPQAASRVSCLYFAIALGKFQVNSFDFMYNQVSSRQSVQKTTICKQSFLPVFCNSSG
jgi:hypothetical protein